MHLSDLMDATTLLQNFGGWALGGIAALIDDFRITCRYLRIESSFEDKIQEALDAQIAARDSKVIEKLVKAAKLPNAHAALERFEAHSNRGITPDRIERLATCG